MFGKNKKKEEEKLAQPRAGHYLFAHQAVRGICRSDPHQFFGVLASDQQQGYLQAMIDQVAEHSPEDPPDFTSQDLQVTLTRIGRFPMVVFSMPAPKAYAECQHVAMVAMLDAGNPGDDPSPEVNCFTLELGEGDDGQDSFFFCQWLDDDHLNIGEMDIRSTISDFALAIKQRIDPD